jgi:hypothetical protein
MQDQMMLTLHWCSVASLRNVWARHCFKWNGCHNIVYELLPHCNAYISKDPTPEIVNTPLAFIVRMGQGACRCDFWLGRQLIHWFWIEATNRHLACTRCKAKNRWHSIDALLTLLSWMGLWVCCILFCQGWLPVCWLWIVAPQILFN